MKASMEIIAKCSIMFQNVWLVTCKKILTLSASHIWSIKIVMNLFASMLTTAMSCDPTPLSIVHASTSVVSLQGVSWITGVGHCGTKGCTRATSLTICRSIRGRTTADSCREDTVSTLLNYVQCKWMQFNTNNMTLSLHMCMHHIYALTQVLYFRVFSV